MYQTEEREYPKTIQIEEYLTRRKQIRKSQQIKKEEENIKENPAWYLAGVSLW